MQYLKGEPIIGNGKYTIMHPPFILTVTAEGGIAKQLKAQQASPIQIFGEAKSSEQSILYRQSNDL